MRDPSLPGLTATPQVGDVYRAVPRREGAFAGRVRVTGFAEWHGRPVAVVVVVRRRADHAEEPSRIMCAELVDAARWERVG